MVQEHIAYEYVSPYGFMPVNMVGGNVYMESAKSLGKTALPYLKQFWSSLDNETKQQVIDGTIRLGITGAKKVGSKIQEGVEKLGTVAEEKLGELLGKKESKKMSKAAKKVLKDVVKETKKKGMKELKKKPLAKRLPKSVAKELTGKQKQKLNKESEVILSNLLYGRGLKIMS